MTLLKCALLINVDMFAPTCINFIIVSCDHKASNNNDVNLITLVIKARIRRKKEDVKVLEVYKSHNVVSRQADDRRLSEGRKAIQSKQR